MPISATGRYQRGFTLVEVLTVVLILGLIAGIVVLSLPAEEDHARTSAYRFAAQVKTAQELAVTRSELVGVTSTASSYGFIRWQNGQWQALGLPGTEEGGFELDESVDLEIEAEGEALVGTAGGNRNLRMTARRTEEPDPFPAVTFTATGEVTAFTASFSGPVRDWRVVTGADGRVIVEAGDD